MATATLMLPASPELVRVARLVAASAARRAGVDEDLIDDIKLAVGEAAGRAVMRHREAGLTSPVRIEFDDAPDFEARVEDFVGPGADPAEDPQGSSGVDTPDALSMALIAGICDRCEHRHRGDGESVLMTWSLGRR